MKYEAPAPRFEALLARSGPYFLLSSPHFLYVLSESVRFPIAVLSLALC